MRGCAEYREQLMALLDGELVGPEQQELEDHLNSCVECALVFEELGSAMEQVSQLPPREASSGFKREFWVRFEREAEQRPWWRRAGWTWALGASLAAGMAAGLLLLTPSSMDMDVDQEDVAISARTDLFSDFEAIQHLELLEDFEAIRALPDEQE